MPDCVIVKGKEIRVPTKIHKSMGEPYRILATQEGDVWRLQPGGKKKLSGMVKTLLGGPPQVELFQSLSEDRKWAVFQADKGLGEESFFIYEREGAFILEPTVDPDCRLG